MLGTVLLCLAGWLAPAGMNAQGCCTAGTSALGGSERGLLAVDAISVGVTYHLNRLDQGYNGTQRIDDPLQRTATVEMLGIEMEYGLAEGVALLMQLGTFSKSRVITVRASSSDLPERIEFKGHGIGDLFTLVKYQLQAPTIPSPAEIALGAGAKLPIGRYRQEVHGTRLSLDLQSGTGATDLLAWAYGGYSFLPAGMKVYGWILYRYPGTNFEGYRYGDETLATLGVAKGVTDFFEVGLAGRVRTAERDFSSGRLLQSTGGVQFSFFPSASYLSSNSLFRVFGQIPVSQNMYGIQLGLSYLLGIEVSYRFDLTSQ
ncbi:MAG: hypothetical protein WEB62_10185 [Bacteroidota bacterium]